MFQHCHNIAIKHNQAVDFPKSGHTPEDLRNKWQGDVPPETVERYPNFMCRTGSSSYKSTRLLGDLFNRVTEVQEIIRVEELVTSEENIQLDESVLIAGDAEYEAEASDAYGEYCAMIGVIIVVVSLQSLFYHFRDFWIITVYKTKVNCFLVDLWLLKSELAKSKL